ncbi:MAG: energy transducer TonB [Prevotella sp.]|nr:energy transducer TonB [Prevotella sp.]
MTHNEQPCKELPIVNTDMYIPINTTGETWYWLSERAKPETATEESDDNEDTSSVSSDDEEEEQRTAIASFDVREEEPAIEEEEEDTPAETSIVSTNVTANNTPQPSNDNEGIVRVPEQYPDFQGGQAALIKYLNENIQYPNIAKENGVQGRVMVRIVVEKDGTLSDVQIVRSVDPSLDKEALRVVKASSGMWKPGYQRGKPVRTEWTVPVAFRLTEK